MIGVEPGAAWSLVVKTGLDSMPKLRRSIFEYLVAHTDWTTTTEIATTVGTLDLLAAELDTLLAAGVVEKRATNGMTAWGPRHKRIVFEGAPVDLFCAERERWGLILTIRTGPASYSHQLVTPRGTHTNDGRPGLLPPHLRVQGGWLTYRVSGQKIETPTEADFYREIGLPYREPSQRR